MKSTTPLIVVTYAMAIVIVANLVGAIYANPKVWMPGLLLMMCLAGMAAAIFLHLQRRW